jgi:glycosyltransferase involved in cell wall biosynthesis
LYLLKAARKKPFLSAKLVSTHHGADDRRGKIRLYEEYYVRRILPKLDAALYVCKADYLSLKRRGLRDSLLYLHHNGVDRTLVPVSVRTAAQEEIRDRWRNIAPGLPQSSGAIYVGAVARLSWEKRHDRMLNVLKNVNAIGLKLPVVLLNFGIGEDEAKLREQAKRLGIESQVFWMGYSKTISQEISGLDLLLCLSDGEGIPINLLEAGWSGTPVFSTSVGGIPDLISNPHLGYLVDKSLSDEQISSDMARALRDTAQLRRVGEKFQEHVVRNFSETAWLERLKAIYREVLLGPQLK